MKRTLVLLIVAILALSLAACGGRADPGLADAGGDDALQTAGSSPAKSGGGSDADAIDTNSVEGVLAAAGFKIDDVKPDGTTAMNTDNDSTSTCVVFWIGEHSSNYADFDAQGYLDKLWAAVKAASDDGEVYEPYKLIFGEKAKMEKPTAGDYNAMGQLGYLLNGTGINLTFGIMPDVVPTDSDDYIMQLQVRLAFNK